MSEEQTDQQQDQPLRDREAFLRQVDLDPGSLCGSWFICLENDVCTSWGVVVAEPQAGMYLLSFHPPAPEVPFQRIVVITTLAGNVETQWKVEWRFFDRQDVMVEAFAAYQRTEASR